MIGLYGGSFDPVHLGHVATAQELLGRLPFREIRFLPAARSPLKAAVTADAHRIAMLERALAGHPGLVLDRSELALPPPSYTVDTLRRARAGLGPDEPLVFILGLDSFLELPRWKDWTALADAAHLLVVSRPGNHPAFAPALAAWLDGRRAQDPAELAAAPGGRVLFVATAPHDIASRTIRAAVRDGADTSRWLAPAVRDYIDHHHLYRGDADPQ
ncbi:MAG TPA: nicotinate-nucleotide adenylyltransferase [Moraxellaceae bacterium]|nr:nicotinate-nucleotide adenylyltransferase [Moraxellaceae bacterium]